MGKWCCLVLVLVGCGRMGFEARLGESAESPANSVRLVYTATIAECIDPALPDLTRCASFNGNDQLVVDGDDGQTNSPWESFLRFDLDTALAGRTVHSVTLVLTSTDDDKADGPDSGAIWEVEPFDRDSLAIEAPAVVRAVPLADSKGKVEQVEPVAWTLPVAMASTDSLYLGIITASDNGGVNYWNLAGEEPPRLEIVAL